MFVTIFITKKKKIGRNPFLSRAGFKMSISFGDWEILGEFDLSQSLFK